MHKNIFPAANPRAKSEAEIFLESMNIRFRRTSAGLLVVKDSLYLNDKGLAELPGLANVVVEGSFHCQNNMLTSLRGGPCIVKGGYFCHNNSLRSLEGAPSEVGGAFDCRNNSLATLDHAPRRVKALFWCAGNALVSLAGAPEQVGGAFACEQNPALQSLAGAPRGCKIISDFGTYGEGWATVPDHIRATPEERDAERKRIAQEATVLRRDLRVLRPLRLR